MPDANTPFPLRPASIEGSIDRLAGTILHVWCRDAALPDVALFVDILINDRLFGRFIANEYREDLEAAGKGAGRHGLTVDFAGSPMFAADGALVISACIADIPGEPFATIEMRPTVSDDIVLTASVIEHLQKHVPRLADDLYERGRMGWGIAETVALDTKAPAPIVQSVAGGPLGLGKVAISNYADFTRWRMRVDESFDVSQSSLETDNFLKWYLEAYSAVRASLRAPLSAPEINHLNEIVTHGGQQYHLSRITWVFLLQEPAMMSRLNLNNADSYIDVVYWWSISRSREMWIEDCLVPASYVQALGMIHDRWRLARFPLSRFMELFFNRRVDWHFLDLEYEQDRCIYYALLMLHAASQPTLLQYVPRTWVRRLLRVQEGETSMLERLVRQVVASGPGVAAVAAYEQSIKAVGFDMARGKSSTVTTEGHRVANVGLRPEMAQVEPVSVQVIGPLQKASGLGQAMRMSYDALIKHFPDCSAYEFDMDNPAPAGFNVKRPNGQLRRAKINLIHLNAESIPLAYAYLPDVFSGAYNIGYFFWELDSPAACHALALELLDEVWVSSEYGVTQYTPFTKRPVTKISMSYEEIVVPDRGEARAYLRSQLAIPDDCFVFFAAFDSFSFVQRKNPQGVVRAFTDAFPNDPKVRLVLKTHNRDFVHDPIQRKIWQMLDEIVQADARITVINETLPYEQLLLLKAGCDCYVSLHRAEGWGFGMIEAMHLGVAVLATGYSGNTEFCSAETAWLVGYSMRALGPGDYIFVRPGQIWAEPDHADAVRQMRAVATDTAGRQERVARAKAFVLEHFSPDVVAQRYADRLQQISAMQALRPAPSHAG